VLDIIGVVLAAFLFMGVAVYLMYYSRMENSLRFLVVSMLIVSAIVITPLLHPLLLFKKTGYMEYNTTTFIPTTTTTTTVVNNETKTVTETTTVNVSAVVTRPVYTARPYADAAYMLWLIAVFITALLYMAWSWERIGMAARRRR